MVRRIFNGPFDDLMVKPVLLCLIALSLFVGCVDITSLHRRSHSTDSRSTHTPVGDSTAPNDPAAAVASTYKKTPPDLTVTPQSSTPATQSVPSNLVWEALQKNPLPVPVKEQLMSVTGTFLVTRDPHGQNEHTIRVQAIRPLLNIKALIPSTSSLASPELIVFTCETDDRCLTPIQRSSTHYDYAKTIRQHLESITPQLATAKADLPREEQAFLQSVDLPLMDHLRAINTVTETDKTAHLTRQLSELIVLTTMEQGLRSIHGVVNRSLFTLNPSLPHDRVVQFLTSFNEHLTVQLRELAEAKRTLDFKIPSVNTAPKKIISSVAEKPTAEPLITQGDRTHKPSTHNTSPKPERRKRAAKSQR